MIVTHLLRVPWAEAQMQTLPRFPSLHPSEFLLLAEIWAGFGLLILGWDGFFHISCVWYWWFGLGLCLCGV